MEAGAAGSRAAGTAAGDASTASAPACKAPARTTLQAAEKRTPGSAGQRQQARHGQGDNDRCAWNHEPNLERVLGITSADAAPAQVPERIQKACSYGGTRHKRADFIDTADQGRLYGRAAGELRARARDKARPKEKDRAAEGSRVRYAAP